MPSPHRVPRGPLVAAALAVFGAASPLAAEVRFKTLADGSTLIYNESRVDRARRTAGRLLPVPRPDLADVLERHARRNRLSLPLVQAVVQVESGYNPKALSNKGAMGLMQLMPATAADLGVSDPYDPDQNVRAGTAYLRRLLDRFAGDVSFALAAYNAGPTSVDRYGGIPPYRETQDYVQKVLALHRGKPPSLLLQDHAREQAEKRRVAEAVEAPVRRGERVYVVRDANNRVVLTTTPPKTR